MSTEPPSESGSAPGPSSQQDLLLDLNFVPKWARGPSGDNPYADTTFREGRGDRRGSRDRDRGRDNKRGGGDRRSSGRGDQRGGQRGGQGGRGGRPQQGDRRGGGGGGDRGDRRAGPGGRGRQGGRGEGRGPRRDGPSRPPMERLAVDIRFLPDRLKLGAMVRGMHQEQKAYPVMDLASLFIQKPDHYQVKVQARKPEKGEKAASFFQYVPSKAIFTTRAAAVQFAIGHHLADYFDVEEIEGEAPAGNFVCVCRCTMTGTLLGPPNYHGYQAALQKMVTERFSSMGLEGYRQRVETVRDPELVEQWKAENRVQKRYRLKADKPKEEPAPEPTPEPEEPPVEEPVVEEPAVEDRTDSSDPTDPPEAATEAPAEEAPAEEAPAEDAPVEEPTPEPEPEPVPADDTREVLTFDQAKQHFQEQILPKLIRETNRATMPATVAQQIDDRVLRSAIRDAWQRESRFPLSMSLAMRPAFRHMRLHLFKVDRKTMFVTPVHPKPIDPGAAIDAIRDELQYLQDHPGCTRQELVQALRPDIPLEDPKVAEVVNNLRWLIDKGHVIEFYNGTLSVPSARSAQRADSPAPKPKARRRRKPRAERKPRPEREPKPEAKSELKPEPKPEPPKPEQK